MTELNLKCLATRLDDLGHDDLQDCDCATQSLIESLNISMEGEGHKPRHRFTASNFMLIYALYSYSLKRV